MNLLLLLRFIISTLKGSVGEAVEGVFDTKMRLAA